MVSGDSVSSHGDNQASTKQVPIFAFATTGQETNIPEPWVKWQNVPYSNTILQFSNISNSWDKVVHCYDTPAARSAFFAGEALYDISSDDSRYAQWLRCNARFNPEGCSSITNAPGYMYFYSKFKEKGKEGFTVWNLQSELDITNATRVGCYYKLDVQVSLNTSSIPGGDYSITEPYWNCSNLNAQIFPDGNNNLCCVIKCFDNPGQINYGGTFESDNCENKCRFHAQIIIEEDPFDQLFSIKLAISPTIDNISHDINEDFPNDFGDNNSNDHIRVMVSTPLGGGYYNDSSEPIYQLKDNAAIITIKAFAFSNNTNTWNPDNCTIYVRCVDPPDYAHYASDTQWGRAPANNDNFDTGITCGVLESMANQAQIQWLSSDHSMGSIVMNASEVKFKLKVSTSYLGDNYYVLVSTDNISDASLPPIEHSQKIIATLMRGITSKIILRQIH
jgi:hypothetical protein